MIDYDTWIYPHLEGIPESYIGRIKHSAFLHGSKLVIFGGVTSSKQVISKFSDLLPSNDVLYIKLGKEFCKFDRQEKTKFAPRAAHSLTTKFRTGQALIFGGYTNAEGYSSDLSEILVLDFAAPPAIPVRVEKGFIRWDDPNNIHGQNIYELIIIDHQSKIERKVYKGNDSFWLIDGLKESCRYVAFVIVSNSIGSSPIMLELEFVHHGILFILILDFISPPENLQVKLDGSNILLEWDIFQTDKLSILFYRICGASSSSRYSRQNKTPWMEITVGSICKLDKPVTFYIGETSSSDVAKEIEFFVQVSSTTTRSEPSNTVVLNLQEYWRNLLLFEAPVTVVETEELMIEGESNPAMITGEDDFEEIAEGETIRPKMEAAKEKVKIAPLDRKLSKIKIKRDFGVIKTDIEVEKVPSLLKKKDVVDTTIRRTSSNPKRKHDSPILENPSKIILETDGDFGDLSEAHNSTDTFVPRKKIGKVDSVKSNDFVSAAQDSEKPSESLSHKINDAAKPPSLTSFAAFHESSNTNSNPHPVSQRLQLRVIEQQSQTNNPAPPEQFNIKNDLPYSGNPKVQDLPLQDISVEPNKNVINEEYWVEKPRIHAAGNLPTINSVECLRNVIMDSSKPMYYNLKYGSDIQVLYDDDWWIAKVLFYAYDENFNLYIKIHFPAWKKSDDLYIPLKDGDRVIRDTSIPVLKKYPTYKATQFTFDLYSATLSGHHGIQFEEIEEVKEKGYLLKAIEKKPKFLEEDD